MIEKKHNFLKIILIYFSIILILLFDMIIKQIKGFNVFVPDLYSIIFFINIIFCPTIILSTNLFIIGIIEDSVLNNILGVSSLVYLVSIYPANKFINTNINDNKQKICKITITFTMLSLVKSMLMINNHFQIKLSITGILITSAIAFIISIFKH